MTSFQQLTTFIGRILLSLIFVNSGIHKLGDHAGTVGYISSVGAPMPEIAYWVAVIVEVGFGLALLVGFKAKIAAAVIALFTLATAVLFHSNFGDQMQMIMFMKNITIVGGLLLVVAYGAGGFSLDNRK